MQKYEKPVARNLGDLQPALGQCVSGQSATPGSGDDCVSGACCFSGRWSLCINGNYAAGSCVHGTSPNYTPYPYG